MHELLKKRRSVRQFLESPIEDEKIHQLLCAGMVAPSGMNKKGYEFVVVKEKETLKKLSKVGRWMGFIADCGVAIVIIAKEYTFWIEDCSLVAENILLEAVNQGLGGCWADVKDGLVLDGTDRESLVRGILKIPVNRRVLCILAIGYSAEVLKLQSEDEYDKKKVHFEWYGR